MSKLSPKPIDIINAAIAEIYGTQAVDLLILFSALNDKGQKNIIQYADEYNELPKYKKALTLAELAEQNRQELERKNLKAELERENLKTHKRNNKLGGLQ